MTASSIVMAHINEEIINVNNINNGAVAKIKRNDQ